MSDDVRTVSALSVLPIRTISTTSLLSVYSLRSLYAVSVLPPQLDVRPLILCHPRCVRDVHTLTILHPLLSAGNVGQVVHPLLYPYWLRTLSVLSPPILANVNKHSVQSPYSLRKISSVLYPFRDLQHPCVAVKGMLMSRWSKHNGQGSVVS